MNKISLLGALAAVAFAGNAVAEVGDFYFKGEAGYGFSTGKAKLESQQYKAGGKDDKGNTKASEKDGQAIKIKSEKSKRLKGAIFGVGVGYNVTDEFRTDLMFNLALKQKATYKFDFSKIPDGADGDDGKVDAKLSRKFMAVMLNGYYDFKNTSDFTPYVGVGVGYASHQVKINKDLGTGKSKKGFAFGAAAGVSYKLSDGIFAELGYKMIAINKAEFKSDVKADIAAGKQTTAVKIKLPSIVHSLNLGLRVNF